MRELDIEDLRKYREYLEQSGEDINLIDYLVKHRNLKGKFRISKSIKYDYLDWNIFCEGLQGVKSNQFKMVYVDRDNNIKETSDLDIYWLEPITFDIVYSVDVKEIKYYCIDLVA